MGKLMEKIEQIVQRIDTLFKQRVIAALIMLYNGIMLLISPHMAPTGMAKAICGGVGLAAIGFLAEALPKKQTKVIIVSILVLAASVYFFFVPEVLSYSLRYLIPLVMVAIGLLQLVQAFQTDRVLKLRSNAIQSLEDESDETEQSPENGSEKAATLAKTLHKAVKEQVDRNLNPTLKMIRWLTRGKYAALISGIILVLFGISILFYPIEGNATITVICGISMVAISLMNLIPAVLAWINSRKQRASGALQE